jgi:hypothetical protein
MVLMVDIGMIQLNRLGNYSIILETWILSWGIAFGFPRGFVKRVLEWVSYWTWSLIGWIVYCIVYVLEEECKLVTNGL